jgi:hypothetical protein
MPEPKNQERRKKQVVCYKPHQLLCVLTCGSNNSFFATFARTRTTRSVNASIYAPHRVETVVTRKSLLARVTQTAKRGAAARAKTAAAVM